MVVRKYVGLINPDQRFKGLEPYHAELGEMARAYHPASAQYAALQHAQIALRAAAELITRQPYCRTYAGPETLCRGFGSSEG